jgi:hypothetical protein
MLTSLFAYHCSTIETSFIIRHKQYVDSRNEDETTTKLHIEQVLRWIDFNDIMSINGIKHEHNEQ